MSGSDHFQELGARLMAEYDKLDRLSAGLLAALSAGDGRLVNLFTSEFAVALLAHMDEEERDSFHGLVDNHSRDARLIIEEHRYIRHRLNVLRREAERRTLRLSTATAFVDELRAHATHEGAIFRRWADGRRDGGAYPSRVEPASETTRPSGPTG